MVFSLRMGSNGYSTLLLSNPWYWGSVRSWTCTVLEARWLDSSLGTQDSLSGSLITGPPLRQQFPATHVSSSALLLPVLPQIHSCATAGHGINPRICASPNSQTQERLKRKVLTNVRDTSGVLKPDINAKCVTWKEPSAKTLVI